MKRSTTIFIFLIFSKYAFGQKDNKHPIDLRLEQCLSIESNFTTIGMIRCEENARKDWERELNISYQNLIGVLDSMGKERLKFSQRKWIDFRDKEIDFANHMFYSLEGTMWQLAAAARRKEIVKKRVFELQDYFGILTEEY